jgi:hypothetical protein
MDKDIYIYKYEESVCFWDILKRVISAASEGNDQPPELSIVFVFFYGSKEREREKRATRLLKDTRKDKMICVYSFFSFYHLTHIHNITFRNNRDKDHTNNEEKN